MDPIDSPPRPPDRSAPHRRISSPPDRVPLPPSIPAPGPSHPSATRSQTTLPSIHHLHPGLGQASIPPPPHPPQASTSPYMQGATYPLPSASTLGTSAPPCAVSGSSARVRMSSCASVCDRLQASGTRPTTLTRRRPKAARNRSDADRPSAAQVRAPRPLQPPYAPRTSADACWIFACPSLLSRAISGPACACLCTASPLLIRPALRAPARASVTTPRLVSHAGVRVRPHTLRLTRPLDPPRVAQSASGARSNATGSAAFRHPPRGSRRI